MIGEAAKTVPDSIRNQQPDLPWRQMGRFRDVVVHHYFDLDLDLVWDIIQTKLEPLAQQIRHILQAQDPLP